MAIIRNQDALASVLGISKVTAVKYVKEGMPFTRKGFAFYFDTKQVTQWLRSDPKKAHLAEALEKYEG